MILITDISSVVNSNIQYGKRGDVVNLVSKRGSVLIVEGINGRFPVCENKVIDAENIEAKTEAVNPTGSNENNAARQPAKLMGQAASFM